MNTNLIDYIDIKPIWTQYWTRIAIFEPAPFLIWPIIIGYFKKGAIFISRFQKVFNYFFSRISQGANPSDIRLFYFQKAELEEAILKKYPNVKTEIPAPEMTPLEVNLQEQEKKPDGLITKTDK